MTKAGLASHPSLSYASLTNSLKDIILLFHASTQVVKLAVCRAILGRMAPTTAVCASLLLQPHKLDEEQRSRDFSWSLWGLIVLLSELCKHVPLICHRF